MTSRSAPTAPGTSRTTAGPFDGPAVLTVANPPPVILHRPDSLPTDGRMARSHRTMERIVRAMLELIEKDGLLRPTANGVAQRAGVSRRALYLHFDNLDEVFARGLERRSSEVLAGWPPPPLGTTTEERIDWFAASWSELLEELGPLCASATQFEVFGGVGTVLNRVRTWMQAAVESVFQPELDRVGPEERRRLVRALHYTTSYTAWGDLCRHGADAAEATGAMTALLTALFATRQPPEEAQAVP